jgi:hypothetical protein
MKRIFVLALFVAACLPAATIDFEVQAANAGGFLTGIPDSPLAIGLATFTGGELRSAEIGLPADESGLYATQGVFGAGESNPLTIQFSLPVGGFSVYVANGDNTATYIVSDDLGDSISASLPSAGAGGARIFSLPGVGIRAVDISSSNTDGWNFAIDDVMFVATPEPGPGLLLLVGFSLLGYFVRRKPPSAPRTMATPDSTYEHAGEAIPTIRSRTHANARADAARGTTGAHDDHRARRRECVLGPARRYHGGGYLSGGGDRHGDTANVEGLAA